MKDLARGLLAAVLWRGLPAAVLRRGLPAATALALTAACAPKVYVIDRATILEEESGGEWPGVDQAQRQRLLKTSPTALKTSDRSGSKEKLTRILEPDESVSSAVR